MNGVRVAVGPGATVRIVKAVAHPCLQGRHGHVVGRSNGLWQVAVMVRRNGDTVTVDAAEVEHVPCLPLVGAVRAVASP